MNRRTFLQLSFFCITAPFWYKHPVQAAPVVNAGQFVFDGVNGLTFPVGAPSNLLPSATTVTRFRALSFFEKLMEVCK